MIMPMGDRVHVRDWVEGHQAGGVGGRVPEFQSSKAMGRPWNVTEIVSTTNHKSPSPISIGVTVIFQPFTGSRSVLSHRGHPGSPIMRQPDRAGCHVYACVDMLDLVANMLTQA